MEKKINEILILLKILLQHKKTNKNFVLLYFGFDKINFKLPTANSLTDLTVHSAI